MFQRLPSTYIFTRFTFKQIRLFFDCMHFLDLFMLTQIAGICFGKYLLLELRYFG